MTIENRVTKLEKHSRTTTGGLAARILAARARTYRHTTTAELEGQQAVKPSNRVARLIRARRAVGMR